MNREVMVRTSKSRTTKGVYSKDVQAMIKLCDNQ